MQLEKGKVKASLFSAVMVLFIKDPNDSNGKFLQLLNTLSKTRGKYCTQKSGVFLYPNGEQNIEII